MSTHEKYSFDVAFDGGAGRRHAAEVERISDELEAAKRQAYDQGFEAGKAQARQELEAQILVQMQQVVASAAHVIGEQQMAEARMRSDASRVACAVGKTLATRFQDHYPSSEIEEMVQDSISVIMDISKLRLRVPKAVEDDIGGRMEGVLRQAGFEGMLDVAGDASMAAGDIVLEWHGGRVARSQREIEAQVDALVEEYFVRETGTQVPEETGYTPETTEEDADSDTASDTESVAESDTDIADLAEAHQEGANT